ncbi:MAG: hypothetical protein PHN88_07345 [Ignavibacteria bacterium]|nr:hypothetical protein [Ignavibacteria bacterium]
MAWQVKYLEDLQIIETIFSGYMKKQELFAAIESAIAESQKMNATKFLSDCSCLEGGHSLFDLYEKANELFSSGLSKNLKEAIILPALSIQHDKVDFWKTVSNNLGFNVRVFQDRDEAIEWLMK